MTALIVSTIIALPVLANVLLADLNLHGTVCGEKICNNSEYCSPFDMQCRPCATVCNATSHNYQPVECTRDCQLYLHDQRYAQQMDQARQYDDLRDEIEKLKYRFVITTTLTCFSLFGMLYLLGRTLIRWKRIQNSLQTLFRRNLKVKAANKNRVQDDVEAAVNKQNGGLKLTIPSISATVEAESKIENNNSSSNTSSNTSSNKISTPNTVSTSLSRRYASEDTTLDYAYDNPAMTPSPEAAQLKIKARESSF